MYIIVIYLLSKSYCSSILQFINNSYACISESPMKWLKKSITCKWMLIVIPNFRLFFYVNGNLQFDVNRVIFV